MSQVTIPKSINPQQFKMGMKHESEHDDVTGGDKKMTAKLVLPHLEEDPKYYTHLKSMEKQYGGAEKKQKVLKNMIKSLK